MPGEFASTSERAGKSLFTKIMRGIAAKLTGSAYLYRGLFRSTRGIMHRLIRDSRRAKRYGNAAISFEHELRQLLTEYRGLSARGDSEKIKKVMAQAERSLTEFDGEARYAIEYLSRIAVDDMYILWTIKDTYINTIFNHLEEARKQGFPTDAANELQRELAPVGDKFTSVLQDLFRESREQMRGAFFFQKFSILSTRLIARDMRTDVRQLRRQERALEHVFADLEEAESTGDVELTKKHFHEVIIYLEKVLEEVLAVFNDDIQLMKRVRDSVTDAKSVVKSAFSGTPTSSIYCAKFIKTLENLDSYEQQELSKIMHTAFNEYRNFSHAKAA